jgi:hypothetical protein
MRWRRDGFQGEDKMEDRGRSFEELKGQTTNCCSICLALLTGAASFWNARHRPFASPTGKPVQFAARAEHEHLYHQSRRGDGSERLRDLHS